MEDRNINKLAKEIAAKTGESASDAIRIALEERLERLSNQQFKTLQREKLNELLRRMDARPRNTDLTDDQILGYDEHGLPR